MPADLDTAPSVMPAVSSQVRSAATGQVSVATTPTTWLAGSRACHPRRPVTPSYLHRSERGNGNWSSHSCYETLIATL
jgi:hypothetical protein